MAVIKQNNVHFQHSVAAGALCCKQVLPAVACLAKGFLANHTMARQCAVAGATLAAIGFCVLLL